MPSDSAKKWVEYLGDVDKILQMAKADFDKGEYQWVAEVTNTIVFADPTNTDAQMCIRDRCDGQTEVRRRLLFVWRTGICHLFRG